MTTTPEVVVSEEPPPSCEDVLRALRTMLEVPEGESILAYTSRLVRRAKTAGIDGNAVK
jgi:hypothetical protein